MLRIRVWGTQILNVKMQIFFLNHSVNSGPPNPNLHCE